MKVMYSTCTEVHGFKIWPASSAGKTDATLLANNSQHSSMLQVRPFAHPVACCLRVAGSCCAKIETGQTFSYGPSMLGFVASVSPSFRLNLSYKVSYCSCFHSILLLSAGMFWCFLVVCRKFRPLLTPQGNTHSGLAGGLFCHCIVHCQWRNKTR